MNRPIKFRGKTLSGEWAYGSLIKLDIGYIILTNEVTETSDESDERNAVIFSADEIAAVNPETVGQFTGLLDKNGTEIYEGDIVSVDDFSSAYSSPYTGKVIMRGGQWCVEYYKGLRCCPPLFFDDFAGRKTEVVGNIHDNPELLKEDKQ